MSPEDNSQDLNPDRERIKMMEDEELIARARKLDKLLTYLRLPDILSVSEAWRSVVTPEKIKGEILPTGVDCFNGLIKTTPGMLTMDPDPNSPLGRVVVEAFEVMQEINDRQLQLPEDL